MITGAIYSKIPAHASDVYVFAYECFTIIICSAEIVDFTKPSGSNSTHPKLFHWVKTYFENAKQSNSLPTTVNSCDLTVQQGSSQSKSIIGCSSKCHATGDDDDIIVIDSDAPVTKKRKVGNVKSEIYFILHI